MCSVLCLICYFTVAFSGSAAVSLAACAVTGFSVGIMWPGVYSLAADKIKNGGIVMFSLLALAGDFGCISGPSLVGVISSSFGNDFKRGFLFSAIFPLGLIIGVILLRKVTTNERQAEKLF
jgi:MFS family permease